MARKLIKLHKLEIPFDLEKLVEQYAKLIFRKIPLDGVDGVCLNLKTPGKNPIVIVNNDAVPVRQKFTLAHELGHIIIPWHTGTFIDDIDATKPNETADSQYWEMEREANRFASELLMPFEWIYAEFRKNSGYDSLISRTRSKCGVSEQAAKIRINNAYTEIYDLEMPEGKILKLYEQTDNVLNVQEQILSDTNFHPLIVARQMVKYLPGKIAFVVEEDDKIIGTGATSRTQIKYQSEGDKFDHNPYPSYSQTFTCDYYQTRTHWWIFDFELVIPDDDRDWRHILDDIVNDINPPQGHEQFKRIVNGKLSGLNGTRTSKGRYTSLEEFIEEANHRFNVNEYKSFIKHDDFLRFLKKRSQAFFGD